MATSKKLTKKIKPTENKAANPQQRRQDSQQNKTKGYAEKQPKLKADAKKTDAPKPNKKVR